MSIEIPNFVAAMGQTGATGTEVSASGGTVAISAAGVYLLTLDQPLDANECNVFITTQAAAKVMWEVVHTNDNVKTIKSWDNANAALNAAFAWVVFQMPKERA